MKSSSIEKFKLFIFGALFGFVGFVVYLNKVHQDVSLLAAKQTMIDLTPFQLLINPFNSIFKPLKPSNISVNNDKHESMNNNARKECNMFDGRWVYKQEDGPKYNSITCPFISQSFRCQSNGRLDSTYENWRWEASNCDIPLFNGTSMLERLRNKRIIFVGDSLNRNMWESLTCLLFTSIPSYVAKVDDYKRYANLWVAKEYNFTIEFFWAPFLVDINNQHETGKKVLVLDKISPTSDKWIGADVMVFNTGHWWEYSTKSKARCELFEFQGKLIEDMQIQVAHKLALKTWATWIEQNVNPRKTTVFFRGSSPVHNSRPTNQWCYNRTQPIMDESYVPVLQKFLVHDVETQIKEMGKSKVKYLNTTKLSEYRIDAHPSLYTTKDEKTDQNAADCSHWCLPGVPDTWNRLLYASLFFDI